MTLTLHNDCVVFNKTLETVQKYTPTKLCQLHTELPPWLPQLLLSRIKQRHALYHKAISTNTTHRHCKSKSDCLLSLSKNPQQFWSYVRSLRHFKHPIPPLKSTTPTPTTANTNTEKANILNQTFSTRLLHQRSPIHWSPHFTIPSDVKTTCTEQSTIQLILSLSNHTINS